jgi:hypothetical protein
MKVGRPCTVCIHPNVNEINKMLIRVDASFRDIAQKSKVSIFALYRHRAEHIPARLAKSAEVREMIATGELVGLLQTFQEQAVQALSIYGAPINIGTEEKPVWRMVDPNVAMRAIDRGLAIIRLWAEHTGQIAPQGSPTINVQNTGIVVTYELPSDGRAPGERERALEQFKSSGFARLLPPDALRLIGAGALSNDNGNGKPS